MIQTGWFMRLMTVLLPSFHADITTEPGKNRTMPAHADVQRRENNLTCVVLKLQYDRG
jgi:hypothetical protein